MSRGSRVRLLSLLLLILVGSAVAASQAGQLARQAEEAIRSAEWGRAISLLRKAVDLEPRKSKYQEALLAALQSGAGAALDDAFSRPVADLGTREKLLEIATSWWPTDPRVTALEVAIAAEKGRVRTVLGEGLALARAGGLAGARARLLGIQAEASFVSGSDAITKEIAGLQSLHEAKSALSRGDAEPAFRLAGEARQLLPDNQDASDTFREAVVSLARIPVGTALRSSATPDELINAEKIVLAGKGHCADCDELHELERRLQKAYESRVAQAVAAFAPPKPGPPTANASCIVRKLLWEDWPGESQTPFVCDPVPTGRVGLLWTDHQMTCGYPTDLAGDFGRLLPAHGGVTVVGADRRAWSNVDVVFEVSEPACDGRSLESRRSEAVASKFVATTRKLDNPDYGEAVRNLEFQRRRVAQLESDARRDPNLQWSLVAAQVALVIAQNRVNKTQPFIEEPVEMPYEFERFEDAVVGAALGMLRVYDAPTGELLLERRIEGRAEAAGWGVRGVNPDDTRGNRNAAASVGLTVESARDGAWSDFWQKLGPEVRLSYARWYGYLALRADDAGLRPEAIATILGVPPEVAAEERAIGSARDQLRAQLWKSPSDVGPILASLRPVALASMAAPSLGERSPGGDRGMLERAMSGVVLILTMTSSGGATGSGFFVSPDGLIVTNAHVVDGASTVMIKTHDDEAFVAKVITTDELRDLALLQVPRKGGVFLRLASSRAAAIGEDVYLVGNPEGAAWTVTKGIVGAVRDEGGVRLIQTDAPMNRGNSGGPLLLRDGRAVGVATWKRRNAEGMGFAVAVDELVRAFGSTIPSPAN